MAGSINFGGLISGIDTKAVIEKVVNLEKARITPLQKQRTALEEQNTALGDLISKLKALKTTAEGLDTASEVGANTVVTSNSARVTGVASGTATPGLYTVNPTVQAKNDQNASSTFASGIYNGAANRTLTITINGSSANVSFTTNDSLQSIADTINNSAVGSKVNAYVEIQSGTNYRLHIDSRDTGAAQTIAFGGNGNGALGMSNSITAVDASITYQGSTYTRASNTISDIIPGITLSIVGTGSTTLTVTQDLTTIETNLDKLVTDFNTTRSAVEKQMKFDPAATTQPALYGDSGVRQLQTRLNTALNKAYNGVSARELGFSTDSAGNLTFDKTKFQAAIANDSTKLNKLFAGSGGLTAELEDIGNDFTQVGSVTSTGVLVARQQSVLSRMALIDKTVDKINLRAETLSTKLTKSFAKLELSLSKLKSQGDELLASLQKF